MKAKRKLNKTNLIILFAFPLGIAISIATIIALFWSVGRAINSLLVLHLPESVMVEVFLGGGVIALLFGLYQVILRGLIPLILIIIHETVEFLFEEQEGE